MGPQFNHSPPRSTLELCHGLDPFDDGLTEVFDAFLLRSHGF